MLEIASQIIFCLLLAALLGAMIGYILGKSSCPECPGDDFAGKAADFQNTHSSAEEPVTKNTSVDNRPVLLSAPRGGEKDNLTRIKGIGVNIEKTLNALGIYHFDQIAEWSKEDVAWIDTRLSFPGRAEREDWVSQARALAEGEETEFSKRVDEGKVASSKKS